MNKITFILLFIFSAIILNAQPDRWQQRAYYQMDIDFDVKTHRFTGNQRLVYQNNSPDTLHKVFYHLYFNAFQPGSMMDMRSRNLPDPDGRIKDRISLLKENEIGYHRINSLTMNGEPVSYQVVETIVEVTLSEPILPRSSAVFEMNFKSQVPLQIRRSGRFSEEGIDYSMAQWYPKMCEYDYQGWHANPYVGREFYGIWGDFDVKISIDEDYILGGTGYLQNPEQIGHGYESEGMEVDRPRGKKLTWHFFAPNVHDFVWAADPDYTHTKLTRKTGTVLHFLYLKNEKNEEAWEKLPEIMDEAFEYINKHAGQYPYRQYSFIQGGDGGMEYPMATLITGNRSLGSLVGVATHELLHSWYQGLMGTNEALYAWMDEGFTNWMETETLEALRKKGVLGGEPKEFPHEGAITGYRNYMLSGLQEPMSMHADHFATSYAYWLTAYTGGETFLEQISYVVGKEVLDAAMLRYYDEWKFKHPNANDFMRIVEKESDLELDWLKEYFINTTRTIDYSIETVEESKNGTVIALANLGNFPMPMDILVEYQNGDKEIFNIPLVIMRGHKAAEGKEKFTVLPDWQWTNPDYLMRIEAPFNSISRVVIDPSRRLADMDLENNKWESNE